MVPKMFRFNSTKVNENLSAIESSIQLVTDHRGTNYIEFRCGECHTRSRNFSQIKWHIEGDHSSVIEAMTTTSRYVDRAFSIAIAQT